MLADNSLLIGSLLILIIELFGIFNAIHATMYTRSAQGAIAWAIALITFPIITIPLYWIFGRDKFRGWIAAIDAAREYILFQFYIVRGNTFKRALIEKAQHGVRVYFIYDEIGSYPLTRCLQINFRNHRKVAVIDGRKTFTGGLNIGNEYWNRIELNLGFWRDTHLLIEGPAVQCIPLSFLEDWYWATRTIPNKDFGYQAPILYLMKPSLPRYNVQPSQVLMYVFYYRGIPIPLLCIYPLFLTD